MTLKHASFVLGEPVSCTLMIENRTQSPLVIDDYGPYLQNRIDFDLRRQPDRTVHRFDPDELFVRLMLMPAERHVQEINLSRHYPLAREGRYFVRAMVQAGPTRYETALRMFDVVSGLELERVVLPVPGRPDLRRTYRLVYWAREQTEQLFLRASDAPGDRMLETVRLGSLVRATPPALQVGTDGQVRILHQASRDMHVLTVLESREGGLRLVEQSRTEDHGTTPLRQALQRDRERRPSEPPRE